MRFIILESKQDKQKFIDKFGQDAFKTFQRYKDNMSKISSPDLTYHVKYTTPEEMNSQLLVASRKSSQFDSEKKLIPEPTNTKQLVYNDNGITVWYITDVEDMIDVASAKYGGVTGQWCIAGTGDVESGECKIKTSQAYKEFYNYLEACGVEGFYVAYNDKGEKVCACQKKFGNGKFTGFWDADNNRYIDPYYGAYYDATAISKLIDPGILKAFGYTIKVNDKDHLYMWNGKKSIPSYVEYVRIGPKVSEIVREAPFYGRNIQILRIDSKDLKCNVPVWDSDAHDYINRDDWGYIFSGCHIQNLQVPEELCENIFSCFYYDSSNNCYYAKDRNVSGWSIVIQHITFI